MNEGLNEILYHLLWSKDKVFDQVVKAMIPDTVIYQFSLPRFWYFTSKSGIIMKKSSQNLNEQGILEGFTKKISSSGIVAMLMYVEDGKHVVDYLNRSSFEKFLKSRKKNNDMILQKFIDPYGEYNFCYTVIWTSNLCLFEKKENKQKLFETSEPPRKPFSKHKLLLSQDNRLKPTASSYPSRKEPTHPKYPQSSPTKTQETHSKSRIFLETNKDLFFYNEKTKPLSQIDQYERAVTFDGKEFHITTTPVRGSFLPNQLIKTADSIVSHVGAVSFEKMRITRMVLQMKLDHKKRLWVLCATCLRFANGQSSSDIQLNFDFFTAQDLNTKNLTTDKRNPAHFVKDCKCAVCSLTFESNKVVRFSYFEIFYMYGQNPLPIYNMHPRIPREDIEKLKEKKDFLKKALFLCFECYIDFVETHKRPLVTNLPNINKAVFKSRVKKSLSISKILPNENLLSSSSVFNPHSLASPSTPGLHSSIINTFSTRTTKTAGGEVIIGFPSVKN
jgi:protein-arginine kinase activator protein McsA